MKALLEMFILPIALGLFLVFAIFGLDKGTVVHDDYVWLIGIIAAVWGVYTSIKLFSLKEKIDELEKRLK